MGRNLSNLYISQSFEYLVQISGSELQNGLGNTITGSLLITSSQAISSSFAQTASYALNAGTTVSTASLLTTASATNNVITFTKGDASTFTITVATGSAVTVNTGSLMVTGSANANILTFTKGDGSTFNLTVATGSAVSASFATTASLALNNILTASITNATTIYTKGDGTTFSLTTNNVVNATSASYSVTADTATSSSFATNAVTANSATSASFATSAASATSASFATNAATANSATTASFASTIASGLNITASNLLVNNNLTVNGTASFGYFEAVTGSVVRVGESFILLNTSDTTRYAGLLIEDSGSSTPINYTASWFYDSQTNDWNYEYNNAGDVDFAVALFGPAYDTKGTPTYLTTNKIPVASGSHHLKDSTITDNGTNVTFTTPIAGTQISASTGFSGNLTGTASFATNAATATSASFATNALSASYVPSTPTFPYTGSAIISGSLQVSGTISTTPPTVTGTINNIGRVNFETGYDSGPMTYRDYLYSTTGDFAIGLAGYKEIIRMFTSELSVNVPFRTSGNATIQGDATIQGNTTIGDSLSDNHKVTGSFSTTGSVNISGPLNVNGQINQGQNNVLSGSSIVPFGTIIASTGSSLLSNGTVYEGCIIAGGKNNIIKSTGTNISSPRISFGIFGGQNLIMSNGDNSESNTMIGGGSNTMTVGYGYNTLIGGANNGMGNNAHSILVGGINNYISADYSLLFGGLYNQVNGGYFSPVLGGSDNRIGGGNQSSILGGTAHRLNSGDNSSIIGGSSHTVTHARSVIIGGTGVSTTATDTVYVPNLVVTGSAVTSSVTNVIGNWTDTYTSSPKVSTVVTLTQLEYNAISSSADPNTLYVISDSIVTNPSAYATTGSNTFIGNQIISGSLSVTSGITGSMFGTASYATFALGANAANSATTATTAISASFATNAATANTASFYSLASVNQNAVFSGSVRGEVRALTITSNTASMDCSLDNFFTLTLVSGSNTFINPSNIAAGQTINLRITQANPGNGTVSFPTSVKQVSGSSYVPSTGTGPQDIVTFISFDASSLYLSNVKNLI